MSAAPFSLAQANLCCAGEMVRPVTLLAGWPALLEQMRQALAAGQYAVALCRYELGGQLLGVIDISGDHRRAHPHTLGLVRSGARMVEHRLFETDFAPEWYVRLARAERAVARGRTGRGRWGTTSPTKDGWYAVPSDGSHRPAGDRYPADTIGRRLYDNVEF